MQRAGAGPGGIADLILGLGVGLRCGVPALILVASSQMTALDLVANKIDRAVQRVTPIAYRLQRKSRRWMRRALRKPRSVSEGPNLLPLLIQVLASFSKADGVLLEEEIDSSLGFLRYDYPGAVYSELRQLFRQPLYEQQDLTPMAQK